MGSVTGIGLLLLGWA